MSIHPTSVIGPDVKMDEGVEIGPFCIIQGDVTIGAGTKLISNVVIGDQRTHVVIGKNNNFHSGAVVGGVPQDLTYKGEKTKLTIGDNNTIREFVTINTGTVKGHGETRVGSNCLLMAYVHIAHDCRIGNNVVIANSCQLAGHVTMEDHVKVGGSCLFNQFVVLGKHSYIAGDSDVNKDILPFCIAQGKYAVVRVANEIGMDRAGYDKNEIENLRRAIRILTKSKLVLEEAVVRIQKDCVPVSSVQYLLNFIKSEERQRGLAL